MGIFGGTFDPVHYGHLRTAFEMRQALRLTELRFVPCYEPPHRGNTYASAELRLKMVREAIIGQPRFSVDDRELLREGPSYSFDTLMAFRSEFPERSLALIIGMDAFLGLPRWYRWSEILQLAHIVIAHRPGWRSPDSGRLGELLAACGTHRIDDIHEAKSGKLYIHDVTQLEISSTEIRELIAAGRDPKFLTPDAVRDVIKASGCYTDGDDEKVGAQYAQKDIS